MKKNKKVPVSKPNQKSKDQIIKDLKKEQEQAKENYINLALIRNNKINRLEMELNSKTNTYNAEVEKQTKYFNQMSVVWQDKINKLEKQVVKYRNEIVTLKNLDKEKDNNVNKILTEKNVRIMKLEQAKEECEMVISEQSDVIDDCVKLGKEQNNTNKELLKFNSILTIIMMMLAAYSIFITFLVLS